MSDRRSEKLLPDLTSADLRVVSRWLSEDGSLRILREPSSADLLAAVRAAVEDGTIEGEVVRWCLPHKCTVTDPIAGDPDNCARREWEPPGLGYADITEEPCRIVDRLVIPVSDGGSET
jgi:hypothetical protein